jgi:hypothetical protein
MPVARPRRPSLPLGLLALVLAAGALLAGGAVVLGNAISRSSTPAVAPLVRPDGHVGLPISGRAIPAYTKITRDDLWDARNGRLAVTFVPESQVGEALFELSKIIGRVLDHDKPAGYAFTERDFLPKGTRPGVVAGIPAGKRALRLDAGKIGGLVGLNPGDRFDVVATQPVDPQSAARPGALDLGGAYGALLSQQLALQNQTLRRQQAIVRVVVQSGVVVSPLETRNVPVSSSTLTSGLRTTTRPVQEMVIAIDPDEVAPLTESMAVGAQLTCLPRSGLPDDPKGSVTPGSIPDLHLPGSVVGGGQVPPLAVLDRIQGDKRDLQAVPASPDDAPR